MFAITHKRFGDPEVLNLDEVPTPQPGAGQILVRVHATALNRADLLQRRGHYPPPPGDSEILGLELAGEVAALGDDVKHWSVGQRVFGLVGGGAYAQYCVMDAQMAMVIPENLSYQEAAAIPEAFFTANETLFTLGELKKDESVLIHAAGSGVGTAGVQMAHYVGAKVYGTTGSAEKIQKLRQLGIDACINYKTQDFVSEIKKITRDEGVNVVEDFIGAKYFAQNLSILKPEGRLILVGLMGGSKTDIDLNEVLRRRLQIKGSVLRTRSLADKRTITQRFYQRWLPALAKGEIKPIIHAVMSWQKVKAAHEMMEANQNFGKIVLQVDS